MLDNDLIQSTFVAICGSEKLLKDRKNLINKKKKLLFKQDMALVDYHT